MPRRDPVLSVAETIEEAGASDVDAAIAVAVAMAVAVRLERAVMVAWGDALKTTCVEG